MREISFAFAIFSIIIPQCTQAYYVSGGLLQHVEMIGKDSGAFSIDIINDEKEEIICDVEYGNLEMKKDGSIILHKIKSLDNFPLKGPSETDPIPSNGRGTVTFKIIRSLAPQNAESMSLGVLVTKRSKPPKFNSTEKISAGLQVVQNYLFQVYAHLNRTKTGQFKLDNFSIDDEKLKFHICNDSENVAEPELICFLTKENQSIKEPIKRKMRILPYVTREYELLLPEPGITKAQVFIDDPHFEIIQKEISR